VAVLTAVLDACVIYPAPLRDLLMYLAVENVYQPRWSNAIHEEWIRNLLANRPDLRPEQLERTRTLMNTHARDSLVTGYESLIGSLTLPDPNDRHVLAIAIHSRAAIIVTFNLADFPAAVLASHGVEAEHPDVFISRLIDTSLDGVLAATRRLREALKSPPKSAEEFLTTLEGVGLPRTAERLRAYSDRI
jgi:predicted nucleic acid-binding protein